MPPIDIREVIAKRLPEIGRDMKWLSLKLGQNETYIQQFIKRGSPRDLGMEQKIKVAELLDLPPRAVGVELDVYRKGNSVGGGLSDDAVPYTLPAKSIIAPGKSDALFQMRGNALETHPLRIMDGDVLLFDMSQEAVDALRSEQIVVAQLYDKHDMLKARTIIRQFVRPALLITNRASHNEIIAMNDPGAPFEAHIKGVFRRLIRGEDD